jgi:hypothetical protein
MPATSFSTTTTMKADKLDDHLVEPETRWEVIDGARVQTPSAQPPQADRHFTMNYAIGAHLAPGYLGASDLLTRWSSDNDYATDTSVRRVGIDEATGERYLEEMVFDVVDAQQREDLDKRARLLSRRGVRRIFAVFAKEGTTEGTVEEWSHAAEIWQVLAPTAVIEDPCLIVPLPVRALLDPAAAEEAVVRCLIARKHPVFEEYFQARWTKGFCNGSRKALYGTLSVRGLNLDAQQRARIEACANPDMLTEWLCRALTATNVDAIFLDRADDEA